MTDEIKPALTPEEWAGVLADPYWWAYQPPQHGGHSTPVITSRHGKAATALYGQPFGFTHEDVAMLREVGCCPFHATACAALADRIAALLPPNP